MHPIIFNEASKIWNSISEGDNLQVTKFELEIHKQLLAIFQVGDYYYYIFNVRTSEFELVSNEIEQVLGYIPTEVTVPTFINNIHPDDQSWFLNIEAKVVEFFKHLKPQQIPNYKVRYDYRIRKSNGEYIRILQQVVSIQHNETGGIIRTLGVHTDISHLKKEGKPVLSFIGLNGEPSYIDVDIKKVFPLPSELLTTRESEILGLLIAGKETKQIAEDLFISVSTVSKHRQNILSKTKAKNTAELIAMAIKMGWV